MKNTELTKREYFAVHANIENVEFKDINALIEFVKEDGEVIDVTTLTTESVLNFGARAAAKARVIFADALLKELNK